MIHKAYLLFASAAGATAVMLGAFGAHALKAKLSPVQLAVFETGVRYQMYHALALLAVALLSARIAHSCFTYSGCAFATGIIVFSGSLYLLACRELLGIEHWKFLGPITPLGGMALILGWVLLGFAVWKGQ